MHPVTSHSWFLQNWFLALVAVTLWLVAYLWYAKLGSNSPSKLWTVPLKKRRDARELARRQAVRAAEQAEQRRLQAAKVDTAAARRDAVDIEER